ASYLREPGFHGLLPAHPEPEQAGFGNGFLEVWRPVMLGGKQVGTVYLRSDLQSLHLRMRQYAMVLLGVFFGAFVLCWILTRRLQPFILSPILHLAQVARDLSQRKDYSIRARKAANDEVGELTDSFNEMLHQIELRDTELQSHRDRLEELVDARTEELVRVNQRLSGEKERAEQASRAKS